MQKRPLLLGLALLLAACTQPPQPGSISGQLFPPRALTEYSLRPGTELVPGQAIVKFRAGVRAQSGVVPLDVVESLAGGAKLVMMPGASAGARALSAGVLAKASDPAGMRTVEWIRSLEARADVEYAVANTVFRPLQVPNPALEPYYAQPGPQKWHYDLAKVPQAWAAGPRGSSSVVVGVLDNGILFKTSDPAGNYSHPDLNCLVDGKPKVLPGYDFAQSVAGDTDPYDTGTSFHGTHVAGTVAACANGKQGTGVAPGVRLLPVRVLDENDRGSIVAVANAIRWAAGISVSGTVAGNPNRAQVINLSLGSDEPPNPYLQEAIDDATDRGSVVVVAAGNEAQNAANLSPANQNRVIVVGATDVNGNRANYSNHGGTVSLVAPGGSAGGGTYSTLACGSGGLAKPPCSSASFSYGFSAGTSMAAPHVSGAVALMLSVNSDLAQPSVKPERTWARVLGHLLDTANTFSGCQAGCGAGMLDAGEAVQAAAADLAGTPMKPFLSPSTHILYLGTDGVSGSFAVTNLGDQAGTWSVVATGSGLSLASGSSVTLAANETKTIGFSLNRTQVGDGEFYGRINMTLSGSSRRTTEVVVQYEAGNATNVGQLRVRAMRVAELNGTAAGGVCRDITTEVPYQFDFNSLEAGIYDLEAFRDTTNRTKDGEIIADIYGTRSSVKVNPGAKGDGTMRLDYPAEGPVALPATCK